MSHSDKLRRGYYGQMRSCGRLRRGSCGNVRAGACKHPSGWRPKFSVKLSDGGTHGTHRASLVQRSLLKIIFVYEAQISKNGIIPDLFGLTLVNFRNISIVMFWTRHIYIYEHKSESSLILKSISPPDKPTKAAPKQPSTSK